MTGVERARVTKELGKAQEALRVAFTIAAGARDLDVAKVLRDQAKAIGTAIVEINGGPVISIQELLR